MPPRRPKYSARAFRVLHKPKVAGEAARAGGAAGSEPASSSCLSRALSETFVGNSLDGRTVQHLAHAGDASGARGVGGLASAGSYGLYRGNIARDIRRRLKRSGDLPKSDKFYWAELPLWDAADERCRGHKVPVLLPHEMLPLLLKQLPAASAVPTNGTPGFGRFEHTCTSLGLPLDATIPLAIWGDGVPYTKKGSLFLVNLSVAGLPDSPRVPLLALPSKALCKCGSCAGRHTLDVFWGIVAWSLRFLALGVMPRLRHDQTPWREHDKRRASLGGTALGQRAVLVHLKGDWEFLATKLGLSSWAEASMCWWCAARKESFARLTAEDIHALLRPPHEYFAGVRLVGKTPCPLFSAPGVSTHSLVVDWMHCVDLGVGQDLAGGALWTLLDYFEGNNRSQRLAALFRRLQEFYAREQTPSRLDGLTLGMLKVTGQPAKLKSKAHECRCLVPFVAEEVCRFHAQHEGVVVLNHLTRALGSLHQLGQLATAAEWPAKQAAHLLSIIGSAWNDLAEFSPGVFRVKPKFHMLQHLVLHVAPIHGSPAGYWCYLDEDWGGQMVQLARHRGGAFSAEGVGLKVLERAYGAL